MGVSELRRLEVVCLPWLKETKVQHDVDNCTESDLRCISVFKAGRSLHEEVCDLKHQHMCLWAKHVPPGVKCKTLKYKHSFKKKNLISGSSQDKTCFVRKQKYQKWNIK